MGILFPVHTMAAAKWNILDDSGCRIAICGYDDDHERSGPAIAAEIVERLNEVEKLRAEVHRLRSRLESTTTPVPSLGDYEAVLYDNHRLAADNANHLTTIASLDLERWALREQLESIGVHERVCRECGTRAWHAADRVPWVLCRACGSQDTRKIKKET